MANNTNNSNFASSNDELVKDQNETLDHQTKILEGQDKLLGKIQSGISDINKKTPKLDLDRDAKASGGTVDTKTKQVIEDIGAVDLGSLGTFAVAMGALGGLTAPGLFQLGNLPKAIKFFKTKTVPKLSLDFGKNMFNMTNTVKDVGKAATTVADDAAKSGMSAIKTLKDLKSKIPTSLGDLTKSLKNIGNIKLAGPKEIASIGAKFGTAAKFLVKTVVGKALSVAGNPIFSYIAQGKDIFDIANVINDDDVKTAVKKEDIGAVVGGFIGGAIGVIGGPAGIALGIGLGNMAGEFIGAAMDTPEVVGAIAKVKTNLTSENTSLAAEILDLETKIADTTGKFSKEMKELYVKQLAQSKKRKTAVEGELKDMTVLDADILALEAIDLKSKEIIAEKNRLEKELVEAEERGDSARVQILNTMIKQTQEEFKITEKRYEDAAKLLQTKAKETSAALADANLDFFDKIATGNSIFADIVSGLGLGDAATGKSKDMFLKGEAEDNLAKYEMELEKIKSQKELNYGDKEQKQILTTLYNKKIKEEKTKLDQMNNVRPDAAARGGFIVNKPTYLPNSGVVVGEHGTYSGRGAAFGGIADGGPEAVIPLGSTRANAFIDPIARAITGQIMNRLQMERLSGGGGGAESSAVIDSFNPSSQVNNNTTVINNPSPIGQTLFDEGRDFVSKVA